MTLIPVLMFIGALAGLGMDIACATVFNPVKIFTKLKAAYDSRSRDQSEQESEAAQDYAHFVNLVMMARLCGVLIGSVFLDTTVGDAGVVSAGMILNGILSLSLTLVSLILNNWRKHEIRSFTYRFLEMRQRYMPVTYFLEALTFLCMLYAFGVMVWVVLGVFYP